MSRCAAALLFGLGLLGFSIQPAAASKVVALIIGNESPEDGLTQAVLKERLKGLKDNLFTYGTDSIIIEGMNLSRDEILARIRKFDTLLANADLAVFYYAGLGAHSTDGASFVVPQGWTGTDAAELVALSKVLGVMRSATGVKGLVFLDALKPGAAATWQMAGVRPGLASFGREAASDKLQITAIDAAPGLLTNALLKQLKPDKDVIQPPQLAAMVRDDVSFESGNIHVPRVFGSVDSPTELKRLSNDQLEAKQKQCVASRDTSEEATTTVADATGRPIGNLADARPMGALGAEPARLGGRFSEWFCPDWTPKVRSYPTVRQDGDAPSRKAARTYGAGSSGGGYRGGGGGYGGGGGHARAAASGAPVP